MPIKRTDKERGSAASGSRSRPSPDRQSDRAYHALKKMLLALQIPPGKLLSEAELMRELGVGRTPLREAVQRLVADGILTVIPRHGTQVTAISGEDLRQIMEIRIPLEVQAAQLAAERATEKEVAALEAALSESETESAPDYYILFDYQMHTLIARAAHNKYLSESLARLYALSVRLFYSAHFQRERLDEMRKEHRMVVDAIRSRDPRAAGEVMRSHLTTRPIFSQGSPHLAEVILGGDGQVAT